VILLAHAGHVILDLLYAAPLLVMFAMLLFGRARERRDRDRDDD
jgi:hypothetical protein